MKIAIASGKGGTGKSTVSLSLFTLLAQKGIKTALIDCDVEEPNCHLFLNPAASMITQATVKIPEFNFSKCTGCRACSDFCAYNALAVIRNEACAKCVKYCTEVPIECSGNEVLLFKELCHSCGGCALVCKTKAISYTTRSIGEIFNERVDINNLIQPFYYGKLNVGEAKSPPLIKQVKNLNLKNVDVTIIDAPPGTSCPAINAVENCDYVFLVTEPTPFGLNDLNLAVQMLRKLKIEHSIIINKSSDSDYLINDYCQKMKINIIAKIPDDRRIAEAYSRGIIFINELPEYKDNFSLIINNIEKRLKS